MKNSFIYVTLISIAVISFPHAYGLDIIATLEKDPFGPNDWIRIFLEIEDYAGGEVNWSVTFPDGATDSGVWSSLSGGKTTHTISRNAFDNQFGDWSIQYVYKNITKTVPIKVEPIVVDIIFDKQSYQSGDEAVITLNTNLFEPQAAKAESFYIQVLDSEGSPALHMDSTSLKAYKASSVYEISIGELLRNNPVGEYKISVQYYNTFNEAKFKTSEPEAQFTIFIGTDKSIYDPGDIVEVNLVISKLIGNNAILTVTDPTGKNTVRSFQVGNSLSRVILDDVSTTKPGTYVIIIEYAGKSQSQTFVVQFKGTISSEPELELGISLGKGQYRPGEALTASITTDRLIADNASYWFQNPFGSEGIKISIPTTSGSWEISDIVPNDPVRGPWKFYVDYGGAVRYAIFFIEGEPVEQTIIGQSITKEGPEISLTIDSSTTNLKKPRGIAIDTNGDIFVVDSGNFEIKKFDSNGRLMSSWGSFGSDEEQFKNPTGILLESEFIHVADTGNSRIQTFDKNGKFVRFWGKSGISSQSLVSPVSIAMSDSGIYYVSDASLNKISKYEANGDYAGHIESIDTAAAKFSSSDHLAYDNNGNLLVLVSDDNRILQFSSNDKFIKSFGTIGEEDGKFLNPSAVAIDSKGILYVADSGNSRVQVFDPERKFITAWGSLGKGAGEFSEISGIAIDSIGNVYVVDSQNNRIQKFVPLDQAVVLEIPDWVRNNAKWWNEGTIEDSDFSNGIQYMIEQKIIVIPKLGKSNVESAQNIPEWIKNNAGWWAKGSISDQEFANGIEYLVKNGIIRV